MNTPLRHHDAIIVGAGIAGCAAAIRLAELGLDVLLVERNRALPKRLAGELLHPPGLQQLLRLGIRDDIDNREGQSIQGFAIFQDSQAPPQRLRYAEIPNGAPRGLGMHHTQLIGMLRERAQKTPGVTLRYARVCDVTRAGDRITGITLRPRGGDLEWVRARLVIGADGRHSRIREALDIPVVKRFISYSLALTIPTSSLPAPNHGHVFLDLPAPTLAYPISNDEARLLFDIPGEPGQKLKTLLADARERYFNQLPPSLRNASYAAVEASHVALAPNYHMMTRRCIERGAALIGDAAGCMHPLTASGMTAGLNDVDELARAVERHPNNFDAALKHYQRQRYRFVRAREILAHALYESFLGDTVGSRAIREGILEYWQASPLGRAFTMGLLAGSESNPGVFVREYLKVAATTFAYVLSGRSEATSLKARGEAFLSVVSEATSKLTWTFDLLRPRSASKPIAQAAS